MPVTGDNLAPLHTSWFADGSSLRLINTQRQRLILHIYCRRRFCDELFHDMIEGVTTSRRTRPVRVA
jgi:hypothetical protein